MTTFPKTILEFAIAVLCVTLMCCGCGDKGNSTPAATDIDSNRVITSRGVGEYLIDISTLEEILGTDSPEMRKRFADQGLNFEFDRGKELTGVTVTSRDYALENEISVGCTAEDVRDSLGEPLDTKIELRPKQIRLDALVYDDYMFLLDQTDNVIAIRVGR